MFYISGRSFFTSVAILLLIGCLHQVANAQINTIPGLLDKLVRINAVSAKDGPSLHAKLNFSTNKDLISQSEMKVVNDGFEDNTLLGIAPKFGDVRTKFIYNLHRYSNSGGETQSEVMKIDIGYRFIRLQHREDNLQQVFSLGLPLHFYAARLRFLYSRSQHYDAITAVDAYHLVTTLPRAKFSVTWQDGEEGIWSDLSTEFRPSKEWKMKYSYHRDDAGMQRKVRSEYGREGYRLAAELKTSTMTNDQTYVTGVISLKRQMKLASLSLNLAHDGVLDNSTIFFRIKTQPFF